MQTTTARFTVAQPRAVASRASQRVVCQAFNVDGVKKAATTFGVGLASLALTGSALAGATVKLGADNGALVFDPATVTISKGDSVTWVNNAGFPHNIVFDEDAVPSGVDASKLGQEDYLNAPGETVTNKFDVAGEYNYYCEPHQGAGMQGKIVVQ